MSFDARAKSKRSCSERNFDLSPVFLDPLGPTNEKVNQGSHPTREHDNEDPNDLPRSQAPAWGRSFEMAKSSEVHMA